MNTQLPSTQHSERELGTTVRSRYRLDALLGRGAMGSVYRAWDLERRADCAVKLLQTDGEVHEAALLRFRDEARMAARIFHPHVVEILDHGVETSGSPFLVMELLRGRDLDAFLKTERQLSTEQTIEIVTQVGSALHAVHQVGIVHRDIKPRNIFLVEGDSPASGFQVKVIDFGLAKHLFAPPDGRGSDGLLIGTPEYLPPESWRGKSSDVDTRADQWALAVLTFRLLTGRLPFESHLDTMLLGKEILTGLPRRIRTLAPDIPHHVAAAIECAMSKDKHERFASIHDFIRALTNLPLTTNTIATAGTELLIKSIPKAAHALEIPMTHEEPTKLIPVAAPTVVFASSWTPTEPSSPLPQTCLLPAQGSAQLLAQGPIPATQVVYEATRRGGSVWIYPVARQLLTAVLGGLIALTLYAGMSGSWAQQRTPLDLSVDSSHPSVTTTTRLPAVQTHPAQRASPVRAIKPSETSAASASPPPGAKANAESSKPASGL